MEIRVARTCLAVASFSLLLFGSGCGSSNSSAPTAAELGAKYKFSATDVPGWQLDPNNPEGAFKVLEEGKQGHDLYSLIDGGSDTYTNAGCAVTVFEDFRGAGLQTATLYAMYMGTEAKATDFFIYETQQLLATASIPGFDASVAAGKASGSSGTAYAHFGTMFIKLTMSGFDGDATAEYQAAVPILNVLKSRTN